MVVGWLTVVSWVVVVLVAEVSGLLFLISSVVEGWVVFPGVVVVVVGGRGRGVSGVVGVVEAEVGGLSSLLPMLVEDWVVL